MPKIGTGSIFFCGGWLRSSIGKKALMAVSGLILVGFVIAHLAGNLLIFAGPDALNAYGQKLRDMGWLLWAARFFLLAAVLVHIVTSLQVSVENRRARPQRYAVTRTVETTWAARLMMVTGILLVAYIVYHLLHLTFHVTNPELTRGLDALGRHDIYRMMVRSFSNHAISIAYLVGVAALCFHLHHGIASTCQSLGLNTERTISVVGWIGRTLAIALFLGYAAIPLAVLLGVVTLI